MEESRSGRVHLGTRGADADLVPLPLRVTGARALLNLQEGPLKGQASSDAQ
ncbi:unnamed protein product [Prunus armeniaca]